MSSALWAIDAARKRKENDIVPGSSRFIISEMTYNLQVSKEGIACFNSSFLNCVRNINGIIDDINDGKGYEALSKKINGFQIKPDLPDLDISSSQSYSSSFKSEYETLDYPWNSELKFESSKKIAVDSEKDHISGVLPEGDKRLSSRNTSASSSPSSQSAQKPLVNTPSLHASTKLKFESPEPEHKSQPDILNTKEKEIQISETQYETEFPVQNNPPLSEMHSEQSDIKMPSNEMRVANSITPESTSKGEKLSGTSPNINLSFIPVINAQSKQTKLEVSGDDDNDDSGEVSFQAISTAIRKSFAGKLSMGRSSVNIPSGGETKSYSHNQKPPPRDTSLHSTPAAGSYHSKPVQVKIEHESSIPIARRSISRPKRKPADRSSLFVTLPSREPIKIPSPNGRFDISSNTLKTDAVSSKMVAKSGQFKTISDQSQRNVWAQDQPMTSMGIQRPLPESPDDSSVPKLFSERSFFNRRGANNAIAAKKQVERTPVAHEKIKIDRPKLNRVEKSKNRTTNAGSPMRIVLNSRPKPNGQDSGAMKSLAGYTESSSVGSSRSPTKYSNKTDTGSVKESPTNFSTHNYSLTTKEESALVQRLTNPTASSAAKSSERSTRREAFMKNRFLNTNLNPDKPPHFNPLPRQMTNDENRVTSSKIPDLHKREPENVSRHPAPIKWNSTTRAKQKITISLKHTVEPKGRMAAEKLSNIPQISPEGEALIPEKPLTHRSSQNNRVNYEVRSMSRKRPFGNAVPLPDAARGNFKERSPKDKSRNVKSSGTPKHKSSEKLPNSVSESLSPDMTAGMLPEVPSDEELLKSTKYIKSWAETPEILRIMKEKRHLDPVIVFGEIPKLDMEEIFRTNEAHKNRTLGPEGNTN